MKPRCLFVPYVIGSEKVESVVVRTPTSDPTEYFETELTPEEAENYALDLLIAVRRAKSVRASREWLEKQAGSGSERTHPLPASQ